MGKLAELMQVRVQMVDPEPNPALVMENLLAEWGSCGAYASLSVILVHLRFLYLLHQTHHWISKGDPFYGDHLMFQRLYEATVDEIDSVAERSVGLGSEQNVNLPLQVSQLDRLCKAQVAAQMIPQSNQLAAQSLQAELNFSQVLTTLMRLMREQGTMTQGLENMLQGIADEHEVATYLLKRRCAMPALGL